MAEAAPDESPAVDGHSAQPVFASDAAPVALQYVGEQMQDVTVVVPTAYVAVDVPVGHCVHAAPGAP